MGLLEDTYGPQSRDTGDVLAQYAPPAPQGWGGLKSYMPNQPDWMKAAQGYIARGLEAIPPEAMLALNFLGRTPARVSASPLPLPTSELPPLPKMAAMRFGDKIFTGANHGIAYENAVSSLGEGALAKHGDNVRGFGNAEGFVTSNGLFMTRKEALEALAAHKLVDNADLPTGHGATLTSEMLPGGVFWLGRRR